MINIQPQNETYDILTARDYAPLNDYEKRIVCDGIQTPSPRQSIAGNGLCPYHPEIVRALSLSHRELLRLLSVDSQIPLPVTPRSSFEIIG